MTWTVTKEEAAGFEMVREPYTKEAKPKAIPARLNVRAIIDIDNEQADLKDLIAALGKHVKMEAPSGT